MIHSVKFTEGYPCKVGTLSGRTFEFKEGVNVLFGRNGCGKSTIVKACAAYGLTRSGWTTWDWSLLSYAFNEAFGDGRTEGLIDAVLQASRAEFKAEVAVDGPVYAHNDLYYDGSGVGLAKSGLGAGSMVLAEWCILHMDASRSSSGEDSAARLNRFIDVMNGCPFELGERPDPSRNSNLALRAELYDYIRDRLSGGVPTVLLDEPDDHLDIPVASRLYSVILPAIAEQGYQVIVATHNPLALFTDGLNLVDVCEGYADESRALYRRITGR